MMNAYCELNDLLKLGLKAKFLKLSSKSNSSSNYLGGKKSLFKGRGMDFDEVRAYAPGDDVRTIDWQVTARKMKPHTKIFREEREKPHIIILDQSNSMMFGSGRDFKSVSACHCAAMLSWSVLNNGDRIGGIIFNDDKLVEIKPKRSKSSTIAFLNQASDMSKQLVNNSQQKISHDNNKQEYMNKAFRHALRVARSGMQLFVISDFYSFNNETEANLSQLNRHNQLLLVLVFDSLEQQLPEKGLYSISDGIETHQINTSNKKLRKNFLTFFQKKQQRIKDFTTKYAIPLISINSSLATDEQLLNMINRKTKTGIT